VEQPAGREDHPAVEGIAHRGPTVGQAPH
jgi:hypothetical protein